MHRIQQPGDTLKIGGRNASSLVVTVGLRRRLTLFIAHRRKSAEGKIKGRGTRPRITACLHMEFHGTPSFSWRAATPSKCPCIGAITRAASPFPSEIPLERP